MIGANGGDDLVFARGDGEFGRVRNLRDVELALVTRGDGGAGLFEEAVEQRVVFVGMEVVAEQPGRARAEPHPVRQ